MRIFTSGLMRFTLLLLMTLSLGTAWAQRSITVSGVVTSSEDNLPLMGATVVIKENPSIGSITDLDGNYVINAQEGQHLIFSYLGSENQEVEVKREKLDIILMSNIMIDEIVKIGYSPIKRKEVTGATIQVRSEEFENVVSSDLGSALQGIVPGLSITSSTGDPGAESNIQIRGVSSMSGTNTPLFVVDGVPQEDNPGLAPGEIESIDILKDAASSAIYGTRGAAGVILITTKQGKSGRMKVAFDAVYGVQSISLDGMPDLLNTAQQTYVEILEGRIDGSNDMETSYRLQKNSDYYNNETNAFDMILRDGISPEQSYTLNLSGGSEYLKYSIMLGYYNQMGVINNSQYDRYNMRSNLNYSRNRFKVNFSTSLMRSNKLTAGGSTIVNAINYKPYSPILDRDATSYTVPGEGYSNEVSVIEPLLRSFKSKFQDITSTYNVNLGADYDITKALSATTRLGYSNTNMYNYNYVPNIPIYDEVGDEVSLGSENSYVSNEAVRRESYSWYGGLNYNKTFNDHKLTAMALASYEMYDYKGFEAGRYAVENGGDDDAVIDMGTYRTWANSYDYYTDQLFGVVSRLMYSYDERYLFSASLRADASSKFSAENRWGYFPSVSGGWNISEEEFWRPMSRAINSFKLRASYGMTGNQSFTSYTYIDTLTQGYDYYFGNATWYGQTQTDYSNPDVKWETTIQTNIGVDLAFMNNSLLFSADYYDTNKRDMLAQVKLPATVGAGTSTDAIVTQNVGNMTNNGIELSLTYKKLLRNGLRITAGVNYSQNKNVVTKLASGNSIMYNSASIVVSGDPNSVSTVFAEGYEAGAFFLYRTDGIVNTAEKLAAYQEYKSDAKMGDMIYVDSNNDGTLSDADRVYCGSGFADFEIGFNLGLAYKGFDLSTNWFGSVGNEIINGTKAASYSSGRNLGLLDQYQEGINEDTNIPTYRGTGKEHMNYIGYSDVWVEDGSYLRLKAITLGYTIPAKKLKKYPISKFRVYVTGQNLLTFTAYTGLDPEVGGNGLTTRGVDKGNYPVSQKVMGGIKVEF